MKSIFISSILLLLSFCVIAQNAESITIGKKEIIASNILKENRNIWIYTPNITSPIPNPDKRYPVLYLLDGDAHFYSTVGIIQQLSQANGNGVLPEMIVVAIENTNRFRDLLPSADLNKPNPFVAFLSSELIPYIDKNYNAAPYKLLVGHSLGGLTAIDLLTNHSELFNAYIAIDPSMWYENEMFLNQAVNQFPKKNLDGKKLFIATANTMPKGMTVEKLTTDTSYETQHIRSIFKFDKFLKTNTNGLLYQQKYYENERHNSSPLLGEYDGLRFIFDYFYFDATEKDFGDTSDVMAVKLKTHYANVSEKMGYKNTAPETLINYLAYDALGKKNFNKAKAFFELNIEWYPNSNNVYDSYAEYYLAKNDTVNAITNYKKALQIKANDITQRKLDALTQPPASNSAIIDVKKYAGIYTLVDFQLDIKLEVRNGTLWSIVPGQPDGEFHAISENVFTVRGVQGYTISFEMNGDKPKGFTSVQPNGTFKAVYKNK